MAKPTGPDWKRIPPERRGRWGRFLVEQRWAHGDLTQAAVRDMLDKMGETLSGPYYSDFETGKSVPSAHWQGVFRRLWNAEPDEEPEPEAPAADLATLVAALDRQTVALTALVERLDRREQEGPEWAEAIARAVLAAVQGMPSGGASSERHEADAPLTGQGSR